MSLVDVLAVGGFVLVVAGTVLHVIAGIGKEK